MTTSTCWQSIEVAPKDGTEVLLFIPCKLIPKGNRKHFHNPMMLSGKWVNGPNSSSQHQPPKHALELSEKHGGYWTSHSNGFRSVSGCPSHWMPLPEAPQ